jgi:hypothetical protein
MIQMNAETAEALGQWIAEKIKEAVSPLKREIAELKAAQKNFRYIGVWDAAARYQAGNFVTVDGSLWHCNMETVNRPGRDVGAWTLVCKRGQDGRDATPQRAVTGHRPNGAGVVERRQT